MCAEVCWAEYGPLKATIIERGKNEIVVEYLDDGYRYTILLSSRDGYTSKVTMHTSAGG